VEEERRAAEADAEAAREAEATGCL